MNEKLDFSGRVIITLHNLQKVHFGIGCVWDRVVCTQIVFIYLDKVIPYGYEFKISYSNLKNIGKKFAKF